MKDINPYPVNNSYQTFRKRIVISFTIPQQMYIIFMSQGTSGSPEQSHNEVEVGPDNNQY